MSVKLEVHQLATEEIYRGWVRIPEKYRKDGFGKPIPEASVVRLSSAGRAILVVVRGDLGSEAPRIRIEALYRDKLGLNSGGSADFELNKASCCERIKYYSQHPDPVTAFMAKSALLALALGIISLVIALVPLIARSLGK